MPFFWDEVNPTWRQICLERLETTRQHGGVLRTGRLGMTCELLGCFRLLWGWLGGYGGFNHLIHVYWNIRLLMLGCCDMWSVFSSSRLSKVIYRFACCNYVFILSFVVLFGCGSTIPGTPKKIVKWKMFPKPVACLDLLWGGEASDRFGASRSAGFCQGGVGRRW